MNGLFVIKKNSFATSPVILKRGKKGWVGSVV